MLKPSKGLKVGALITGIIILVIIFNVVSTVMPTVNTAVTAINNSGVTYQDAENFTGGRLPFNTIFNQNGLVVLGIMAVIVLGVFAALGYGKGKR